MGTGPDDDPHWVFRRPLGEVPLAAEITARVGAVTGPAFVLPGAASPLRH